MNAETFRVGQVVKELGMKNAAVPTLDAEASIPSFYAVGKFVSSSRKWKDAYVFTCAEVCGWTISASYPEAFGAVVKGKSFEPRGLASP